MDSFHARLSLLLILLLLAGCGGPANRASAPPGRPIPVIMAAGVLQPLPERAAVSQPASSGSGATRAGGGLGSLGGCSGKEALIVLGVLVVVVVVVGVVMAVVAAGEEESDDAITARYYLTLSGADEAPAVVPISSGDELWLDDRQYAALARGAYTRAVLRPSVWEGTLGAPTQLVRLSLQGGRVTVTPLAAAEDTPTAPR